MPHLADILAAHQLQYFYAQDRIAPLHTSRSLPGCASLSPALPVSLHTGSTGAHTFRSLSGVQSLVVVLLPRCTPGANSPNQPGTAEVLASVSIPLKPTGGVSQRYVHAGNSSDP